MRKEETKPELKAAFIRWLTSNYNSDIRRVECTRQTESSIWVLERPWSRMGDSKPVERRRSLGADYKYHETWEAARQFLIERAASDLKGLLRRAQETRRQIASLRVLKAPADAA